MISTVAVKHGGSPRRCFKRQIKGFKYKPVIVRVPENIGNNGVVMEVQDGAEVSLLTGSIFKLRYISEPFLVWC